VWGCGWRLVLNTITALLWTLICATSAVTVNKHASTKGDAFNNIYGVTTVTALFSSATHEESKRTPPNG
jgi:hypothetical protein